MVAIFTGLGAGFQRGSFATLGGAGLLGSSMFGRGGEGIFLNAATGNLLLQRQDEFLVGLGPDAGVTRTYNSAGVLDDNGDHWRQSTDRRVFGVTGTLGASGSTVKRVSADGSEITYAWKSGFLYETTDGDGAHDQLSYDGTLWTWRDGSTQATETYGTDGAGNWRITQATDTDGNSLTFSYTGAKLTSITTADGASITYTWSGTNITSVTTSYTDLVASTSKTMTRTSYGYDGSDRLTSVTVDMTPENLLDSVTYTTTYTYESTSTRVHTITQTDGSSVEFAYDGSDRVTSIAVTAASSDVRTTSIVYGSGYTQITDPRGLVTKLTYDGSNRLTRVDMPPATVGATPINVQYTYDSDGNVTRVTDGASKNTDFTFDSHGNVLTSTDPNGVVVTRSYDAANNVSLETRSGTIASGSASLYTRYIYDAENHLAYAVSAEGYVTEYRYTSAGLLEYTVQYPQHAYTIGSTVPSLTTMNTWRDALSDRSTTKIEKYVYDARGGLTDTYSYGAANTGGVAVDTEGKCETHYVYDQAGQLLQRDTVPLATEHFVYDGLGRITSSTDINGGTTTIAFADASTTTTVTTASNYVVISTYNKAGELLNRTDSGSSVTGGATVYSYDKNGQVRIVKHQSSNLATTYDTSYALYDKMGRKVADIGQNGEITQYRYDVDSRLIATTHYYNTLTGTQLSSVLASATSEVDLLPTDFAPPSADSRDIWQWIIYDDGGRIVETIAGDGAATRYEYDAGDRLIKTTTFANKLSVSSFISTPPLTPTWPTGNSADRIARTFYDGDGRVVAALNAEGGLSQILYDSAGQKIQEIAYATLTSATYRASGTLAQLLSGLPDAAKDASTRYIYDGQGLLRYAIDALSHVTEFVYAQGTANYANGAVRKTIVYKTTIAPSDFKFATVKAAIATDAADRVSYVVYGTNGQPAYTIDAAGAVTRVEYDIEGRATKVTQFATLMGASDADAPWTSGNTDALWLSKLGHWQSLNTAGGDRITRTYYSSRGEAIYTADAEGYVTGAEYDTQGRIVASKRYPNQLTITDSTTIATLNAATKGTPVTTTYAYDALGRLADTYDGVGARRHMTYYATGTLATDVQAYGQSGESVTAFFYDQAGHKTSESHAYGAAEQANTYFAYDGLGNLQSVTDARSNVTTYTYDRVGRVVTVTNSPDGSTNYVTVYDYDAIGRGVKVTDARGNASYSYFDRMGRVTLTIDAGDYATETAYTAFSEVLSVKRYYTATTAAAIGSPPTLTTNTLDATTSFEYDKLGHVTKATDAESAYEQYTLNAFGERSAVRNKLGGVTNYTFYKRGLTETETLPLSSIRADGTTQSSTIVNKFEYDARGNRTKVIEAYGLTEQRTTTYQYDDAGRVIHKISDAFTAQATPTATAASVTPTEDYYYNLRGDLIETRDAAGGRALYWYDKLGRVTHKVGATKALTRYYYDANGNVTETRVYADLLATMPSDASGSVPGDPGTSYRSTLNVYDKLNRVTSTKIPSVKIGYWDTASGGAFVIPGTSPDLTTAYSYDALDNVVLVTAADGGTVYSYFDKLGRKKIQIDGANYRIDWGYDTNGNALSELRYATVSAAPTSTTTPPTAPSTSGDDRTTNFTYDKMGRRLTEIRTGVKVHDGSGGESTVSSTVTYQYNALSEVTRKTEASGDFIDYVYDVGGRMTQEQRSAFTDFNGNSVTPTIDHYYDGLGNQTRTRQVGSSGTIAVAERVTTYAYGNASNGGMRGKLVSVTDAENFARTYRYDAAGRVAREEYVRTMPTGTSTEGVGYEYDLNGRVVRQGSLLNPSGSWTRDGANIDTAAMEYNAFGEVSRRGMAHYTSGAETTLYTEKFEYDAAGRLVRTNAGDGAWKYFMYDKAGNQTLVIASVGTDLNTTSYDSVDEVLTLWSNAAAIGTTNVTGIVATITRYDGRGQAIEVREPKRQRNATTYDDLVTQRAYNAFGEIAYEINAAAARVDYSYNTMGRLIKTESPSVEGRGDNGKWISGYSGNTPNASSTTATTFRPVEKRYYDASGRLVASRDANGNLTKLTLLAGTGYNGSEALVSRTTGADTFFVDTFYDIHGDARRIQDQLYSSAQPTLHVTTQVFDKLGRVTAVTHKGGLIDYYKYDELGQRTKHWNSLLNDEAKAERWFYDQQGRITKSIAIGGDASGGADASTGGDVVQYSYAWDGTLTTTGMSSTAFGGWTQTTTYYNSKTLIEKTDVFGHSLSRTDMAGSVSSSVYDKAGRVTQSGSLLNMVYFNSGRLAEVYGASGYMFYGRPWFDSNMHTDNNGAITYTYRGTTYEYDALGNVTRQKLREVGTYQGEAQYDFINKHWDVPDPIEYDRIISDQTATFDALGRIVSWAEAGGATISGSAVPVTPWADHSFAYDAAGNIRRSLAHVGNLTSAGAVSGSTTQDYWYLYDSMNRMTTSKGGLSGTTISRGSTGIDTLYDAVGNRVTMYTPTVREDYTYNNAGQLATVRSGVNTLTAPGTLRSTYGYDAMNHITSQIDYESNGTTVAYSRTITFNDKGLVTGDITDTKRGSIVYRQDSSYDYGTWANGKYALGAPWKVTTINKENGVTKKTNITENSYGWSDSVRQTQIKFTPDSTAPTVFNTTTYTHTWTGRSYEVSRVDILDGRKRTVMFTRDMMGQVINRDEKDSQANSTSPHEVWYRFSGRELGYVGNNGTIDTDNAASINDRQAAQGTGAFKNGAAAGTSSADFDLAYDDINSYEHGSNASYYLVQAGDTLSGIAASLWGDADLWYKLAEANGLQGDETLIEGTSLTIPAGVIRNTNNASTFTPYDPAEIIGNVSPTTPKPPKRAQSCGGFGQILLVVIAIAVTALSQGAATGFFTGLFSGGAGTVSAAAATAGVIAGGAAAGAAGSIASQAVGVATGIQDKFSWNAVALAAIGGGVGGGLNPSGAAASTWQQAAMRAATASVITQGVGVATGLQDKFSWAGVAAAGVGAAVGHAVGARLPGGTGDVAARTIINAASGIANAASRSLIEGSDFGDNLMAALPDIIGQTIGEMVAGGFSRRSSTTTGPARVGSTPKNASEVKAACQAVTNLQDPRVVWEEDPESVNYVRPEDRARAEIVPIGQLPAEEAPEIIVTAQRREPRPGLSPEMREIARAAQQATIEWRNQRRAAERQADAAAYQVQANAAGAEFNRYALNQTWQFARDWAPGISDVNGFYEAYRNPNALTVGAAVVGLVPIGGDLAGKFLRHLDDVPLNHLDDIPTGNNIAYRRMSERDVQALDGGGGLTARDPTGSASAVDHILNRAGDSSPWISTTRRLDVAQGYHGDGPIAMIDLDRVPTEQVEVWRSVDRNPLNRDVAGPVAHDGELAFQRSFWAEEVTVYQAIPPEAIIGVVR